jgi:hypothetical protein
MSTLPEFVPAAARKVASLPLDGVVSTAAPPPIDGAVTAVVVVVVAAVAAASI